MNFCALHLKPSPLMSLDVGPPPALEPLTDFDGTTPLTDFDGTTPITDFP
jgi:hypothetical protein